MYFPKGFSFDDAVEALEYSFNRQARTIKADITYVEDYISSED